MAEKFLIRLGDSTQEVEVEEGEEGLRARLGDRWYRVSLEPIGAAGLFSLLVDDDRYEVLAERRSGALELLIAGRLYFCAVQAPLAGRWPGSPGLLEPSGETTGEIVAPMAGAVVEVLVQPEQVVAAGEVLLVVEAMKMNNEIRAPRDGTVEAVYVQAGQRIAQGTALLLLR